MATRGWRLAAVAGVALLAAVCASGADRPEGARAVAGDGPLPLDRYQVTPEDGQRAQQASALLVRQCMAASGHPDFPLEPRYPSDTVVLVVTAGTDYGVSDLDAARRWGYGWDPDGTSGAHQPTGRRMTGAEYADLPACSTEAHRRLMRGVDPRTWLYPSRRAAAVDKEVTGDPRLRAAWDAWSRCVADRGFTRYPDPVAASTDPAWHRGQDGNTGHTRRERDTAVADVLCKRRLHTVEIWHDVKVRKQAADIARHRAAYAAALTQLRTYRANINAVLTSSGQAG